MHKDTKNKISQTANFTVRRPEIRRVKVSYRRFFNDANPPGPPTYNCEFMTTFNSEKVDANSNFSVPNFQCFFHYIYNFHRKFTCKSVGLFLVLFIYLITKLIIYMQKHSQSDWSTRVECFSYFL